MVKLKRCKNYNILRFNVFFCVKLNFGAESKIKQEKNVDNIKVKLGIKDNTFHFK